MRINTMTQADRNRANNLSAHLAWAARYEPLHATTHRIGMEAERTCHQALNRIADDEWLYGIQYRGLLPYPVVCNIQFRRRDLRDIIISLERTNAHLKAINQEARRLRERGISPSETVSNVPGRTFQGMSMIQCQQYVQCLLRNLRSRAARV